MSNTIRISGIMRKYLEEYREIRIKEYENMGLLVDAVEFREMCETQLIEKALFEIVFLKNRD